MLQKHGMAGVIMEYEQGTGRIESLAFKIDINDHPWGFAVPPRTSHGKDFNKSDAAPLAPGFGFTLSQ